MQKHAAENRRTGSENSSVRSDASIRGVDGYVGVNAFCQHTSKGCYRCNFGLVLRWTVCPDWVKLSTLPIQNLEVKKLDVDDDFSSQGNFNCPEEQSKILSLPGWVKAFLSPVEETTRRTKEATGEQKGKEREKREVPVPKTHLERIGLAVSGGREVEDTPLGEPGDGVYSVSWISHPRESQSCRDVMDAIQPTLQQILPWLSQVCSLLLLLPFSLPCNSICTRKTRIKEIWGLGRWIV